MLDLNTLILMTGAGNLAFALLLTVFSPGKTGNQAFDYWRTAKFLSAFASLLTVLRPWLPQLLTLHGAHAAHFASWTLELMAYCVFLGKVRGLRWWPRISAVMVLIHLALLSLGSSRTPSLISFSLIGAYLDIAIAITLFRSPRQEQGLTRLLGLISGIGAVVFVWRAGFGLHHGAFSPDELKQFNQLLFFIGFLHMIGNSFGFLLLTRQQDEQQLKQALERVSQAEREQRQLLTMASHEFRTPAAMIKASLDSLQMLRAETPAEVSRRLHNIHLATQRMIQLANHLISQDRFQELALAPSPEHCELGQLVSDIVASYDLEAQLLFEPPADAIMADVDPVLLSIALNNLIDNATRHGKNEAGEAQAVNITLSRRVGSIELRVADQGPGIPDEDKTKVFQRFYNLRGNTTSGIGLSIVHTIAHAHHGTIRAEDNAPHGTVMVLALPSAYPR